MYVLIPKSTYTTHISAGSGIVTAKISGIRMAKVYYEGNHYGASNLVAWSDRVINAAGRCHQNYPTTAVSFISAEELSEGFDVVGTVDCDDWLVNIDPNQSRLISAYVQGPLGSLLGSDMPCKATVSVNGSFFRSISTVDFNQAVSIAFNIVKKHFSRGSMVAIKDSSGMQTNFMIP